LLRARTASICIGSFDLPQEYTVMLMKFRAWVLPAMILLFALSMPSDNLMAQDDADAKKPDAGQADDAKADDAKDDDDDAQGDDPGLAGDNPMPGEPMPDETLEPKPGDVQPVTATEITVDFIVSNLWIMIAGMLVFIMHLGFATLESGLTRSKNTVNILFKNSMIICIGLITYGICGFNLMYPGFDTDPQVDFVHTETGESANEETAVKDEDAYTETTTYTDSGYLKFAGFGFLNDGLALADADAAAAAGEEALARYNANSTPDYGNYTWYTDFFFQAMFAATCCTIVSGAVAGRIKLSSFLIFATLFVGLCYPITGSWKWGYGWLDRAGFYDFAGSTLVHSVGGWGALILAILLGARKGKYVDGKVNAMPASNMPLAAIGVFLLWFGWFGFNGGSVLSADPGLVSMVLVMTSLAAAAGGLSAAMVSWAHGGKPDLSMALNGILAGLVGITAGADQMSGMEAIAIGVVAGVLVYFAVIFIDSKLKIDDPVGAVSVHLVCGIWGTMAVGIFGAKGIFSTGSVAQLIAQLKGVLAIGGFTVIFCLAVGLALKSTMGLRVEEEEEEKGLDISEHGMQAYTM
jgi:Amt family ammonium transporter